VAGERRPLPEENEVEAPDLDGAAPTFGDPIYEVIYERARPYLQTRHNDVHTLTSYGFVLRLLAHEAGDPAVAIPAILLHDIGWSRVPEDRQLLAFGPTVKEPELTRVHEREGAAMAADILRKVGYPEAESRAIIDIVGGHDTRLEALNSSDALVKDADKLFRLSRVGFRIDYARFARHPEAYLAWLEKQVDPWFFTDTGKRLARAELAARARELAGGAGAGELEAVGSQGTNS